MNTVLGIDMGTQSIKLLVYDYESKKTMAAASEDLEIISKSDGTSEQKVEWWIQSLKKCADSIDKKLKQTIKAIGVSGQQHGFVPLDSKGRAVYNVKLWNDVSTAAECEEITQAIGGEEHIISETGNKILPGYTASKILWLKKNKPELYKKLAHILLPHDYMNYFLTGEYTAEYGDASGTAFFDIRNRCWSKNVLKAIDPDKDLFSCLPPLKNAEEPAGHLTSAAADFLGLSAGIAVSSGGGDNMMGAIGTGSVREGVLTMSLGTSGTIYTYSEKPLIDPEGNLAAFCSSTGGWLPLLCTMNCTSSTEKMRTLFDLSIAEFNSNAELASAGAGGIIMLPYFNGERTPNLPAARAVMAGMDMDNFTKANILRSSMESTVFGLKLGFETLSKLGVKIDEVRLIGGGAKSALWRKITADILDVRVIIPVEDEAAAFGAALQALWVLEISEKGDADIAAITDEHVCINSVQTVFPDPKNVEVYKEVYSEYKHYLQLLKPKFCIGA